MQLLSWLVCWWAYISCFVQLCGELVKQIVPGAGIAVGRGRGAEGARGNPRGSSLRTLWNRGESGGGSQNAWRVQARGLAVLLIWLLRFITVEALAAAYG